jgi:hypothetical protein
MNTNDLCAKLLGVSIEEINRIAPPTPDSPDPAPVAWPPRVNMAYETRYNNFMEYHIRDDSYVPTCNECGVLVSDETQHDKWHEAITIAIRALANQNHAQAIASFGDDWQAINEYQASHSIEITHGEDGTQVARAKLTAQHAQELDQDLILTDD